MKTLPTNVGEVVDLYQSNLTELLQCLELLWNQWTEYCDRIENPDISPAHVEGPSRRAGLYIINTAVNWRGGLVTANMVLP